MNSVCGVKSYFKSIAGPWCFFIVCLLFGVPKLSKAQYSLNSYANHKSLDRQITVTDHLKIVYQPDSSVSVKKIRTIAEKIYDSYRNLLGVRPENIKIYLNNNNKILSAAHASNIGSYLPLWNKNVFLKCFQGTYPDWLYRLRYEIAYVFQQATRSSQVGLWQTSFLSSPTATLWSTGLPAYLSVPFLTKCDVQFLQVYWDNSMEANNDMPYSRHEKQLLLGRSQINFYSNIFSADRLQQLYNIRKSFLGIEYFDFGYAFQKTFGASYRFFTLQWKRKQFKIYNDTSQTRAYYPPAKNKKEQQRLTLEEPVPSLKSEPYHSFLNIQASFPIVIPYYLNTSGYGLGVMLAWESPLRLHEISLAGFLSISAPIEKSIFYSSYVNNSLGPRIKLSFKHYTSQSEWIDLSVMQANTAAISSLWKIDAWSRGYSNWYTGIMLRRLSVNYFSNKVNREKKIAFDNRYTTQTDLRFILAWRKLMPTSFNVVHPLKGYGVRLSVTGSVPFLNDKTQYARFYSEAFVLIPTVGKQRIYLYGAGALDINDTIGADYLYFSDNGDYEYAEPNLMGATSRTVEGYIRGYKMPIAGERFLWGKIEYRIPLVLKAKPLLFGLFPLPETAVAFFADAGVIGQARSQQQLGYTEYRYSVGAEIKVAMSFRNISLVFKVGAAQALDKPFGPVLFFNIQPALPF